MKKILITVISVVTLLSGSAYAQETEKESKVGFSVGTDVVSSYVFRGTTCSEGFAVQPGAEVSVGGLAFGTWASKDVDGVGAASELDLYLSYSIGGFSIGATHFYYFDDVPSDDKYAFFGEGTQTELSLAYTISDELPLSISWNTMIGGSEVGMYEADKRPFSTYIELGYSHSVLEDLSVSYALGISPWSSVYGEDFSIPNLSVRFDHELALGDACTMGSFLQPVYNAETAKFACVLGCGFWF